MSVNIRIPNIKGDQQMCVGVTEAQKVVSDYLNKDWIVAVNHEITKTESIIKDGDNVVVLPHITGG